MKEGGDNYLSAIGLSISTFDPVTGVLIAKSTQCYDGNLRVFYVYRLNGHSDTALRSAWRRIERIGRGENLLSSSGMNVKGPPAAAGGLLIFAENQL